MLYSLLVSADCIATESQRMSSTQGCCQSIPLTAPMYYNLFIGRVLLRLLQADIIEKVGQLQGVRIGFMLEYGCLCDTEMGICLRRLTGVAAKEVDIEQPETEDDLEETPAGVLDSKKLTIPIAYFLVTSSMMSFGSNILGSCCLYCGRPYYYWALACYWARFCCARFCMVLSSSLESRYCS